MKKGNVFVERSLHHAERCRVVAEFAILIDVQHMYNQDACICLLQGAQGMSLPDIRT